MSSSKDMPAEADASKSLSKQLRPAITTNSLGNAGLHPLKRKLEQLAEKGFKGVELCYPELEHYAKNHPSIVFKNDIFKAAKSLHELCKKLKLTVISIQPFAYFEGLADEYNIFTVEYLTDKLAEWVKLAYILRADMILIPANYFGPDKQGNPRTSTENIVPDLRVLTDRGTSMWRELINEESEDVAKARSKLAKGKSKTKYTARSEREPATYTLKFTYEALAWADHIDTWQKSWEVVKQVDRSNFGMCLDTFNIGAKEYAEPALFPRGVQIGGEEKLWYSLTELSKIFKQSSPEHHHKLFLVQVADGERLLEPLVGDIESPITGERIESSLDYVPNQPVRMTWSRTSRLFPFETSPKKNDGMLPIIDILRVIVHDLNYRGWVSMDVFHRDLDHSSRGTTAVQARKGWEAWEAMIQRLAAMKMLG